MSVAFTVLLALGIPSAGNGQGTCGRYELAQEFNLPPDDTAEEKKPAKLPPKKRSKPRKIGKESDLWTEPVDSAAGRDRTAGEEAEEIPEEEIEDVDEGKSGKQPAEPEPGGLGGWGADVERDTWGDEERIEKAESIPEEQPPPKKVTPPEKKKPPKSTPDAGIAKAEPEKATLKPAEPAELEKEPGLAAELGESGEILPPSGSLADLTALWEQRRIHLDQRDFELARGDLERLIKLKKELGVRNMTLQANVLVRESRRVHKAGNAALAQDLLNSARELAPDLALVYRAQAALWFSESPFKVGRVFGAIFDAAGATLDEPLSANRFKVNLLVGLLLGLGLAGSIFLFVLFFRCLRLFLHDFHHLFPKGVARLQSVILAVMVLVIPVLLHRGLVTVLLFWGLIAWVYQERRERIVTAVVLVFFTAAPFALQLVVSGLSYPESLVPDLLEVNRGAAHEKSIKRLRAVLNKQPENYAILATLGDFHKRTGDLERAQDLLTRALALRPNSGELLNNLGNVYFLKNELAKAVNHYDRASKIRTDSVVPSFNLSRAYFKKLDLDKGKEYRRYALSLNQKKTNALVERAGSQKANDVVADLPLPAAWLTDSVDAGTDAGNGKWKGASGHIWNALGGIGTPETIPFVGGGILVLYVLVFLLSRKLYLSRACMRCGQPVCRRCTTELRDNTVCGQCFHAFMHRDQVDAKSRISKEIQARQHGRRKESIARGITFLLPGAGQLIKERPLRGILFLVVFSCVLVQVFLGHGIMRNPQALEYGIDWLKMIPLIMLFLGFYAWAILDVFREN